MSYRAGLEAAFARILAWRVAIVGLFALLVPLSIIGAGTLRAEGAIGSLVVPSDPDYATTRAFQKIFPETQIVLWLLEFDDPYKPPALATMDAVAKAARSVPGVTVFSTLDIYRRNHSGFAVNGAPDSEELESFKKFVKGADALRRQGLAGDHFLTVGVAFPSRGPQARDKTLSALDAALARVPQGSVHLLRKVGGPYLESWIERESREAQLRGFPIFALMVVGFTWFLYRSPRALAAIMLSLATAVALALGAGAALGYGITIVSALVPLTVLVTTLASLVYLHSRFVDQAPGSDLHAHHLWALADKFLPVTVSSIAAILGFAALAISPIRPVREMGLWTALGLALSWLVSFTLFPALQRMFHTPTDHVVAVRSAFYDRLADAIPGVSYRLRWVLLIGSLVLSALGVAALFGVPGYVKPVQVSIEGLDYIDPELDIYRDMTFFRDHIGGLNVARVWIRVPSGSATDPEMLRGVDRFTTEIERVPMVTSVVGPSTFLRMRQYLAGKPAVLPKDPAGLASLTSDLEALLLSERELRGFIDVASLSHVQLSVTFRRGEHADYDDLRRGLAAAWKRAGSQVPALREAEFQAVGEAMLQAKVGASLVPTLTHSFALTAGLIFVGFLAVFRSPSARLMAMIPSLFAILVTFLGLRLFGGSLNLATILIATTVLGTTENDQIHFFYHLQEGEAEAGPRTHEQANDTNQSFEPALRHALRVSGRAIFFATVINATSTLR